MYLNSRVHERTAEAKADGVSASAHAGETFCSFLVPFTAFSCAAKQDGSAATRDWLICMHEMKLFFCVCVFVVVIMPKCQCVLRRVLPRQAVWHEEAESLQETLQVSSPFFFSSS